MRLEAKGSEVNECMGHASISQIKLQLRLNLLFK
jgi:hypothetical protein